MLILVDTLQKKLVIEHKPVFPAQLKNFYFQQRWEASRSLHSLGKARTSIMF